MTTMSYTKREQGATLKISTNCLLKNIQWYIIFESLINRNENRLLNAAFIYKIFVRKIYPPAQVVHNVLYEQIFLPE